MIPERMPTSARFSLDGVTVGELLVEGSARLAERGVDSPRLDCELLLAASLGEERVALFTAPERRLTAGELVAFEQGLLRREAREPLAYILGYRHFWEGRFRVVSGVLIPRPDSETLVRAGLERWGDPRRAGRILELGVGSGAILLSLLQELPAATGVGVDLSPLAIGCTAINARELGLSTRVELRSGSWWEPLEAGERFGLIVANPPYIAAGEYPGLQPEITGWEPELALVAGEDGLSCYRELLPAAGRFLEPGGWLGVEIGERQGRAVSGLMEGAGLREITVLRDYGARERVVMGRWLG